MTDWTKALDKLHRKGERYPDGCVSGKEAYKKGWRMMEELCEDSPVGNTNTRKMVAKALYAKPPTMEAYEGVVVGGYGKLVRRIWYRPVDIT